MSITFGNISPRIPQVEGIFVGTFKGQVEGGEATPRRRRDLQHPLKSAPSAIRRRSLHPANVGGTLRQVDYSTARQVDAVRLVWTTSRWHWNMQ